MVSYVTKEELARRMAALDVEGLACERAVGRHVFVDTDPEAELWCLCGEVYWPTGEALDVVYIPAFLGPEEGD